MVWTLPSDCRATPVQCDGREFFWDSEWGVDCLHPRLFYVTLLMEYHLVFSWSIIPITPNSHHTRLQCCTTSWTIKNQRLANLLILNMLWRVGMWCTLYSHEDCQIMKVFALGRYSSRNVFAGVSLDYSSHGTHSSLSFIHNASVYRYAQLLVDELLFTCIACSAPPPLLLDSKSRRKPISPVGRSSLSGSPVVDSPQRPFVLLLWCVHFQIAVTSSFRR